MLGISKRTGNIYMFHPNQYFLIGTTSGHFLHSELKNDPIEIDDVPTKKCWFSSSLCNKYFHIPMLNNSFIHVTNPRPRPSPRQGRRLGPPQVWNLFRFRAFKRLKPSAAASTKHSGHSYLGLPQPSATITAFNLPFARLQALKCSAAASTRHAGHSHCYYWRSRLPFARPQRPKTLNAPRQPSATISAFEAAVCPPQRPKMLRGSFDQALRPQPSATIGIRGCRLPALKGLKRSAAASTRHSGHSHLRLSAFEAAVCPPSKA